MDPCPAPLPTDAATDPFIWWVKEATKEATGRISLGWRAIRVNRHKNPAAETPPEGKQAALSCALINADVHVRVAALIMAAGCGKHDHSLMHMRRWYDFTI